MSILLTLGDPPRGTHTGHTHLMQHHAHDEVTSCYAIPTRLNAHLTHAHTTHDKPHTHTFYTRPTSTITERLEYTGGGEGYPHAKRFGRLWFWFCPRMRP